MLLPEEAWVPQARVARRTPSLRLALPPPATDARAPSSCRPGPNAPLSWVRACVQMLDPKGRWRSKILLGLNFYGSEYAASRGGREPVVGTR